MSECPKHKNLLFKPVALYIMYNYMMHLFKKNLDQRRYVLCRNVFLVYSMCTSLQHLQLRKVSCLECMNGLIMKFECVMFLLLEILSSELACSGACSLMYALFMCTMV